MKSRTRTMLYVAALAVVLATVFSTTGATVASITTDQTSYSVGQTMNLSGSGFSAGKGVNVSVLRPDHLTDYVLNVAADATGAFKTSYTPAVPQISGNYKITATDVTDASNSATVSVYVTPATITTDKKVYHLGETIQITGSGFLPSTGIALTVRRPDKVTDTVPGVISDGAGAFKASYPVAGVNGAQKITATDGTNTATTTAVDPVVSPSVTEYSQCSNDQGTGYSTGDTGCRWTNGNLQRNNSLYHEDDATVQRLFLKDVTGGVDHTVTFQYDTSKQSTHAYDFLVDDTHSESYVALADLCDNATANGFPSCTSGGVFAMQKAIPADPNVGGRDTAVSSRNFKIRNGTITSVEAPIVALGTFDQTTQKYIGDTETDVRIHFTVDDTQCADRTVIKGVAFCPVLISFGAHISKTSVWTPDVTAVNISGSPYHVALHEVDGTSPGQKDNQMQAEAIVVPATLTLVKNVVNNYGTPAVTTNWTLSAAGPTPISGAGGTSGQVSPGSYTLSESGTVAGYTNGTSYSCVLNGGAPVSGNSITLAQADIATCTITNTAQPAHLTLAKVVNNNHGGTKTVADFPLTASGPTTITGTSGTPAVTNAVANEGTYALSEITQTGYTASNWVCVGGTQTGASITLALGQSATCTITNSDNQPSLHLRKVVVNDNGGKALVTDFTLSAAGPTPLSGTSPADSGTNFVAGTYALSETNVAGYTASAWTCVGGSQSGSNITIALGESATCTITNDDSMPSLHLRKVVVNDNGGTATTADFTLSAAGATPLSGTSPVDSGATFAAGTYALSETPLAGYTASAWVCVGGAQAGSNITLALGESATCTITNDDDVPALHLRKVVVNDNGGTAALADFTLSAAGATPLSGTSPVDSGTTFRAGTYALSETVLAGYTASAWVCVGGSQSGSNITLAPGQSATCTITNDDKPSELHLRKVVVNDNGGSAVAADFTLSATGPTPISGTASVDSGASFFAGAYALTETGPNGYTASDWVCAGGTQAGSNITVAPGQIATCTITNNDTPPVLHLRKVVVNDNGGTATAADFPLFAAGATPLSGTSPVDSGANFSAGTYALSETPHAGYTASDWVCVGGSQAGGNITLAVGQTATCTITNNDNKPALHLRKVVVNDNGGAAVAADFTLTGTGPTSISGTATVDSGDNFSAGTYALTESGPAGYTASDWVCIGGAQSGGNITVALGESATCTITNNDKAPELHLRKIVANNYGGAAVATDFTLTGTGPSSISGPGSADSGAAFKAGTYGLSETSLAGYSAGAWVCVGGAQSGSNITVALGQSATCTITNSDIPAHLIVIKNVVGGGLPASAFTMSINGVATLGDNLFAGAASPGVNKTLLSVGGYSVTEGAVAGYAQTGASADCSGTIRLGETKTCVLTNSPLPTLVVQKYISGPTDTFHFALNTAPFTDLTPPANGSVSGTPQFIAVGNYQIDEVNMPIDWLLTGTSCVGANGAPFVASPTGGTFGATWGDAIVCRFVNEKAGRATRTQGFWSTHTILSNTIWNGGTLPAGTSTLTWAQVTGTADQYLCKVPTTTDPLGSPITATEEPGTNQLLGSFWSNVSKVSTARGNSGNRTDLAQARMQMLQQYMAAVLNVHAFGTPIVGTSLATARTAYCGTDVNAIRTQQGLLATYNSSGDTVTFNPGVPATAPDAKKQANIPFWDETLR